MQLYNPPYLYNNLVSYFLKIVHYNWVCSIQLSVVSSMKWALWETLDSTVYQWSSDINIPSSLIPWLDASHVRPTLVSPSLSMYISTSASWGSSFRFTRLGCLVSNWRASPVSWIIIHVNTITHVSKSLLNSTMKRETKYRTSSSLTSWHQ